MAAAVSDGTRRAYSPYWNRVLDQWADISLSDRTPTDIQRLVQRIKANLTVRRNTRNAGVAWRDPAYVHPNSAVHHFQLSACRRVDRGRCTSPAVVQQS